MSASTKLQIVILPAAAVSIAHAATTTDSPVLTLWAFLIAGLGAHAWYRAAEPTPHEGRRSWRHPSRTRSGAARCDRIRVKGTCHRRSWAA
ncbi:hypothetical protein [Rhodococcus qingshengii]|uniref:hypothetical protein n=1 Tax=Rhodococcus qingshengii TaxID=334542 RepID=UPI001C5CCAA2|nr:hypothetical protein [Rhodococcus qingshengii]MBW4818669.1 hypothetical protein [Rhodococcus qingshengii]